MSTETTPELRISPPLPENYPIRFDLRAESKLEGRYESRTWGRVWIAAVVAMGFAFVFGILLVLGIFEGGEGFGWALIGFGVFFSVLIFLAIRATWARVVTGIRLESDAIEFDLRRGKPHRVEWADPKIKMDIGQLLTEPEAVFPEGDPHRTYPQWINVFWRGGRIVTLDVALPSDALGAILGEAYRHSLTVSRTPVAWYWERPPNNPGFLAYETQKRLKAGRVVNGYLLELRRQS